MSIGYVNPREKLLSDALDIAMNYLDRTGQAEDYRYVEAAAMGVILQAHHDGVRHKLALANRAIMAAEKPRPSHKVHLLYPPKAM